MGGLSSNKRTAVRIATIIVICKIRFGDQPKMPTIPLLTKPG